MLAALTLKWLSSHFIRSLRTPKTENQSDQENEKWLNLFIIILHGLGTISNCLDVLRDVNNRMRGAPFVLYKAECNSV